MKNKGTLDGGSGNGAHYGHQHTRQRAQKAKLDPSKMLQVVTTYQHLVALEGIEKVQSFEDEKATIT